MAYCVVVFALLTAGMRFYSPTNAFLGPKSQMRFSTHRCASRQIWREWQGYAQAFQARTVLPIACVGKNLTINIGTQPASGSAVFTIRVDGVDTAYTLTIAAGSVTGTYQNTASSINFSNGATIDVKIQNNASASTGAIVALSMIIEIWDTQ